jgi:hypothetical protein
MENLDKQDKPNANRFYKDKFCRNCGGFLVRSDVLASLSDPPQYKWHCKDCGDWHYLLNSY